MNKKATENDEVRTSVRDHYGKVARQATACCSTTCCAPGGMDTHNANTVARALGYSFEETEAVPEGANLGLGCGNPLAVAALAPGLIVLDLGSGAGFDALLAARAVGPSGKIIGVDMTPEMIAKAKTNLAAAGVANVEFRLGEIERLPVADSAVDVIISNCVINLSPDKGAVFAEAFRVLKPGGRLAVSDIVALAPLPGKLRLDMAAFSGCVGGAALVSDIEHALRAAGFEQVRVKPRPESAKFIADWFPGREFEKFVASAVIQAVKPRS